MASMPEFDEVGAESGATTATLPLDFLGDVSPGDTITLTVDSVENGQAVVSLGGGEEVAPTEEASLPPAEAMTPDEEEFPA
ncbi:MAG TPA: hypothetical protein PKJ00_03455 [Verrucomicrobiota bacterium]|nr:hypothetical protein [Verrucomicrobiota bacterium]HNS68997.1 hypothetical protein [Verrucomicrobiota bacterium]